MAAKETQKVAVSLTPEKWHAKETGMLLMMSWNVRHVSRRVKDEGDGDEGAAKKKDNERQEQE